MSTAPTTLERVDTSTSTREERTPPPPTVHYLCPCQQVPPASDQPHGYCGAALATGKPLLLKRVDPPRHCIVCRELVLAGVPCRYCGKVFGAQ